MKVNACNFSLEENLTRYDIVEGLEDWMKVKQV